MSAPTGFTTVTGKITRGSLPVPGNITFTPVLDNGESSAFNASGESVEVGDAINATVASDGTFSVVLADCLLSNPVHMKYHVRMFTSSDKEVFGLAYNMIEPTGSTWDLNQAQPSLAGQVPVVQGVPGPPGLNGENGEVTKMQLNSTIVAGFGVSVAYTGVVSTLTTIASPQITGANNHAAPIAVATKPQFPSQGYLESFSISICAADGVQQLRIGIADNPFNDTRLQLLQTFLVTPRATSVPVVQTFVGGVDYPLTQVDVNQFLVCVNEIGGAGFGYADVAPSDGTSTVFYLLSDFATIGTVAQFTENDGLTMPFTATIRTVTTVNTSTLVFDIGTTDGSPIQPGYKRFLPVPFGCSIKSVAVTADKLTNTILDIWKCSTANYGNPSSYLTGLPTFGSVKFGTGLTGTSDTNYVNMLKGALPTSLVLTIEAWVEIVDTTSGGLQIFFSTTIHGSDSPFWIGYRNNNLCVSVPGTGGMAMGAIVDAGGNINDGTLHHVAVVLDSGGTILRTFIDGQPGATLSGQFTGVLMTSGTLGRYQSTGYGWAGSLDEVIISNYAKYTTAFVPASSPATGLEPGTVSLYHLDGDGVNALIPIHPDVTDSIVAGDPPSLSNALKSTDSTLSGWVTAVAPGDVLALNVISNTAATKLYITLTAERTS
jgi:hypothetical protein